jgi:hypothetical protein
VSAEFPLDYPATSLAVSSQQEVSYVLHVGTGSWAREYLYDPVNAVLTPTNSQYGGRTGSITFVANSPYYLAVGYPDRVYLYQRGSSRILARVSAQLSALFLSNSRPALAATVGSTASSLYIINTPAAELKGAALQNEAVINIDGHSEESGEDCRASLVIHL